MSYLLDANILIALLFTSHVHHKLVLEWFSTSTRNFALCSLTEAGFLRYAIAPRDGQVTLAEASTLLLDLAAYPGYRYLPIDADWHTLCAPFSARLQGTKQITDAYLLGLAVRNDLTLVTLDRGILHMAGREYAPHVLLLQP